MSLALKYILHMPIVIDYVDAPWNLKLECQCTLLRSVTTKGNHLRSHGHKGERPIGEEAYKILYPLGGRPTPSGCTGIDQSEEWDPSKSPHMDIRASIKETGEGAQTHRVLLGKRSNPTPYLERWFPRPVTQALLLDRTSRVTPTVTPASHRSSSPVITRVSNSLTGGTGSRFIDGGLGMF